MYSLKEKKSYNSFQRIHGKGYDISIETSVNFRKKRLFTNYAAKSCNCFKKEMRDIHCLRKWFHNFYW